jgi:CRISPR-associated endonuclease Csy4
MNHYVDLQIRPVPEMVPAHVLEKVFAKIHLALVTSRRSDIGLSFPDVNEKAPALGGHLRLHGSDAGLRELLEATRLDAWQDYLVLGGIEAVPEGCSFRLVSRVQVRNGLEARRRRLARRHNLSLGEAAGRLPDSVRQWSMLPFIRMRSHSTGQHFRLFIKHGSVSSRPSPGPFNAYGLSQEATIPWF